MKDGKIFIVTMSDVHIGAHNPVKLEEELNGVFLKFVSENAEEIDIIVINGDLFDGKLNFEEESGRLALRFFNSLYLICIDNGIKIRLVRGTLSHDLMNQLNVFSTYIEEDEEDDIVMIITANEIVTEFELNGVPINFLYVPEEYPKDSDLYFKHLYSEMDTYGINMAFVHGTFDFTAFLGQKIMSEKPIKTAPVFDSNEMMKRVTGHIIAGHIHSPITHKDKIFYCCSFSRNSFGEDKDKGFVYSLFDPATETCETKRVINYLAPKFVTISLDEIFGGNTDLDVETKIKALNKAKEKYGNVRFTDSKNVSDVDISLLKSAFRTDESIKISSKKEKVVDDTDHTYDFVFNKELLIHDMISKFLLTKFGTEVDPETVKAIIAEDD